MSFQEVSLLVLTIVSGICLQRWMTEQSWLETLKKQGREFVIYLYRPKKKPPSYLIYLAFGFGLGKVFLVYQGNSPKAAIVLWAFYLGLIIISVIDLKKQVIYTESIFMEFILCIVYFFICQTELYTKISGCIVGIIIMTIIYLSFKGGMGAGDIYLSSVLGLWLGWPLIILCLIMAFVFGAIVGCGYLLCNRENLKRNIPFAPYLVIAGAISFIWGAEILVYYQTFFF